MERRTRCLHGEPLRTMGMGEAADRPVEVEGSLDWEDLMSRLRI